VDFGYTVSGADLTKDTTAALYWSSSDKFANAIGGPIPGTSQAIPAGTLAKTYGPFHVDAATLGAPPPTATHLLAVTDPDNVLGNFDASKNVLPLAIPDIKIVSADLIDPRTIKITFTVDGYTGAFHPPFQLGLYWSRNDVVDSGDRFAGGTTIVFPPEDINAAVHTANVTLTSAPPAPDRYLLAMADPDHLIPEANRTNNVKWVCPATGQGNYGDAPREDRQALTNARAWEVEAQHRAQVMRQYLGSRYPFAVTSVVRHGKLAGGHGIYEKMDVVPEGQTSWEQLALAAAKAGFWVHAEGVKVCGIDYPLSELAKRLGAHPHLDLYNIVPYSIVIPPRPSGLTRKLWWVG
jgi:hypothetical protein